MHKQLLKNQPYSMTLTVLSAGFHSGLKVKELNTWINFMLLMSERNVQRVAGGSIPKLVSEITLHLFMTHGSLNHQGGLTEIHHIITHQTKHIAKDTRTLFMTLLGKSPLITDTLSFPTRKTGRGGWLW